ncbi:MAG: GxxExxY protein [Lyngbya sp.]|nr:GxxExxY protein [Lyngbya sp.]
MHNSKIPHQELTYKIIGCAMRVHSRTQRGLREKHYQRALTLEMRQAGLTVEEEHSREVYYEENWIGILYLDHWVNNCIVVEDKAVSRKIEGKDIAQIVAYLSITNAEVGLFLNFGRSRLEYHRILPPKSVLDWRKNIQPYLWQPRY